MDESETQRNSQTAQHSLAKSVDWPVFAVYFLLLGLVSIHLYHWPIYDMDSIQYMGNALLMEQTDPVRIHQRVYAELNSFVPDRSRQALLGHATGVPEDQNRSRQERASNPYRFAEFLPMFAIRPLYNQTLYLVSKTGIGLVRAGILISVGSYFLIGILLFLWTQDYTVRPLSLVFPLLVMICPPLMDLGRDTTSDALATLIAFAGLYLLVGRRRMLSGLVLLLASIYFRTDFVVLAGPTLVACWLGRRLAFWKAGALALVAISSVLCINHFAGDYGIKMLYYRNFVGTPVAPGEMTVHFSFPDYLFALRSGVTKVLGSFFLPFLLLGTVGLTSRRMRVLFALALAYVLLHFLILPNWQERWVGLFYLAMCVCAVSPTRFCDPVDNQLDLQDDAVTG